MRKSIEIKDKNGKLCCIYVKHIATIMQREEHTIIYFAVGEFVRTETSYEEVKSMIAACDGGEDEED